MQKKIYATLALIAVFMLVFWNDGDFTAISEGLLRIAHK